MPARILVVFDEDTPFTPREADGNPVSSGSGLNASKGGVASFAETLRKELMAQGIRLTLIEPGAIGSPMQPFSEDQRAKHMKDYRMLPPGEVAEAILFAATRGPGVDVDTLRIEPLLQKIY